MGSYLYQYKTSVRWFFDQIYCVVIKISSKLDDFWRESWFTNRVFFHRRIKTGGVLTYRWIRTRGVLIHRYTGKIILIVLIFFWCLNI